MKDQPEKEVIYFLWEYGFYKGYRIGGGKKTHRIYVPKESCPMFYDPHDRYVKKEKTAYPDEKICIVEEYWRCSGRPGYRIERQLYPEYRIFPEELVKIPPCHHARSKALGRITEDEKPENM